MADRFVFNPFTGKLDDAGVSTPVSVANGGTGVASYTQGDILFASGATTIGSIVDVATGQVLTSGGVGANPVYSASPTLTTSLTVPTVYGSSSSAGNLVLQSTSNATRGTVQTPDLMTVGTAVQAIGASTSYYVTLASGNLNITTGAVGGILFSPTFTVKGNSAVTLTALFNTQAVVTDDGTARILGPALIFANQFTYTATVASGITANDVSGLAAYTGHYHSLTLNRTGSGTGTLTTSAGVHISNLSNIGVGWTVTNYIGMLIDFPTVGGTLTNFYGVKNNGAAGTTRWFLYETGGMQSSHKGNLRLGDNTAPTALLDIQGTINTNQNIANGSVATVLGSIGPVGSHTTVQEWLKVNIGGVTRFIPCF